MRWTKNDKTNISQSFSGFVKAGKLNENYLTTCFTKVTKYWGVHHRDRFARLYHYSRYSKTNNTVIDLPISTILVRAKPSTRG